MLFPGGERCYDPHTSSAPCTSHTHRDAAVVRENYQAQPLAQEKVLHVEHMCHRYIAQSRWLAYIAPKVAVQLPSLTSKNRKTGKAKGTKARKEKGTKKIV